VILTKERTERSEKGKEATGRRKEQNTAKERRKGRSCP
jgi:hypothetical protein